MGSEPTVTIVPDPDALADAAARLTVDVAAHAIAARGRFMWALAGGETPRTTYERLALPPFRERVDWRHTWVFFGDERAVPPDDAGSNYRMAHEALLSRVPIPAAQVLRIRGEAEDLEVAAADYARALGEAFGTRRGALPRFDLVLLGLGVDGHTASLFPDSPVVREVFRAVAAVHVAAASIPQRLTLTLPVFNAAARVVFLVTGAEKAKVVKAVLSERATLPAAMVRPADGELVWLLDRAAAARARAEGRRGDPVRTGEPALLLRDTAEPLRRHHREPRGLRPRAPGGGRLHADHHREAVRARLRERAGARPPARGRLPRGAGLPDRPLPRQGDRPEHPRVPVRQRHLRASVEPQPRGRGPADRRRVHRRRDPRRVLRGGGGAARHDAEPPAPAPLPDRHEIGRASCREG